MAAVEVATGCWRVPLVPYDLLNAFLLDNLDGSLTLLDTGTRGSGRRLLEALESLGRRPEEVSAIVLSHAHVDHAGGMAAAQAATGAAVASHDREAVYLREGRAPAPRRGRAGRLLARVLPQGFPGVPDTASFGDGTLLPAGGGLRVVHTPGHTPGHCSFLHEPTGTLLTGDAVMNVRGLRHAPRLACTDHRLAEVTAARLADLDFDAAAFTHGREITRGAPEAVRAFLAGRPS